jgi:peptidoglycan/xylan/chitin deacetylase (PgdA/CDA1 family)
MEVRRPHTREALQARRALKRRKFRIRRLTFGGLAIAATAAGVALGAPHHAPAPKKPAEAIHPILGIATPLPRVFPKRDRLSEIPYVAVAGRRHREIALTFDDGPGPYTLQVLHALKHLHTPATFFQVGMTEHYWTQAERAELRDPLFVIGDHTESHKRLDKLSQEAQATEIDGAAAVLESQGVPAPTLFRPPYGAYDARTLQLLQERHMTMVMWSIDSQDYLRPGVDRIVQNVLGAAKPGAIVLMHDAGGDRSQTIAALPRIVAGLRERGYTLVSVPRLLEDAPPPLKQPVMGIGAG